jgi:superfamily I DNA/RNA helicase
MVSINDLDAVQARVIEEILDNRDRNHWVKGFAGSGKTIVLTHVLERLATTTPPVKVCFATFTHALKDLVESGLSEHAKERIHISTFNGLGKLRNDYDIVVADEMQDIPSRILPTLARKSDVLVIAADMDQSIYRSACSIAELRSSVYPAIEHRLPEIHRINETVFDIATTIYSDAEVVGQRLARDDNDPAHLYEGDSMHDEFVIMFEEAVRVSAKASPSAILLPSKALLDKFVATISKAQSYKGTPPSVKDGDRPEPGELADPFRETNDYLRRNKSPLQVFGGGSGSLYESDSKKMVYLMTYHSAKGLDFSNVFLPHLTDDVSLEPMKGASDDQERRLFFVAATRARERLYLSYHGEPHRFIEEIPDYLLETFKKKKRTY